MKQLPPKRFQDTHDPIYDPIRWEKWFWKLDKRRAQNSALAQAHIASKQYGSKQKAVAASWGVDPRELRDYAHWVSKGPRKPISAQAQAILDLAYTYYCDTGESIPIQKAIRIAAPLFGERGRPIEELWEIHPNFYPTGYCLTKT